jgi:hypothetical protein
MRTRAENVLFYWAVRELRIRGTFLAKRSKMSPSGLVYTVNQIEEVAKEGGYRLSE